MATILVTGASSGIGKACALLLAANPLLPSMPRPGSPGKALRPREAAA